VILVKTEVLTAEDCCGPRMDDFDCSSIDPFDTAGIDVICDVDCRQWRLWSQVHGRSHSLDLFLPVKFAATIL
jgi:hypothetical protein